MKKKLSLIMAMSISLCSIQSLLLTANAGEETLAPLKLIVRIYNSETNETVENVNVKVCTFESFDFENVTVYDEWNTSESNPHKTFVSMDSTTDKNGDGCFFWELKIDEMPEGYSYKNHSYFDFEDCDNRKIEADGTYVYEIPFDPVSGVEELEFPLHDTLKCPFNFTDQITGEAIEGVKVKFYELPTDYAPIEKATRLISEWTYKQGDIIDVPFEFNDMNDRSNYAFVIEGLPENYVLMSKNGISYFSMSVYDYNDIKNNPDKPFGFMDKPFSFDCLAVNPALSTTTEPIVSAPINSMMKSTTTTTVVADITGDANCDNNVNIADATSIMQHIGNRDKYALSEQGLINADCCNVGDGVTGLDAIAIQKLEAKQIKALPLNE